MWAWSSNVGRTGAGQKEYEEESTLKGCLVWRQASNTSATSVITLTKYLTERNLKDWLFIGILSVMGGKAWQLTSVQTRKQREVTASPQLCSPFPPFYSVQNLNPWMMLPTFEAVFLLSSGKSHWKYVHKLTKRHVSLMPSASCKPIKLTTEISHRKEWEIKNNWV